MIASNTVDRRPRINGKARRVLVVGDAVVATGFARVIHSVFDRLHDRYDVHHLGVNYLGDPHDSQWKIYPAGTAGDGRGFNRLGPLLASLEPDLIFMVGDLWVLMQYAGILARLGSTVPAVAYFPVESDPVEPDAMVHLLRGVKRIVTCTEFGAAEVRLAIERARSSHPQLPALEPQIVPHGVDRNCFYPLEDIDVASRQRASLAARRALFPNRGDLDDAFIVLNANRNQPRKRIDVTMEAFALFARDKPAKVRLYLHMARQDTGWDIVRLARRLGIADRLLVTKDDNECRDESVEQLNLVYNACDIGVNTSSAEGFGLVAFEHAATGAAQIVPAHTSQVELWEGAAELVEPRFSLVTENILTRAYYVTPPDVAQAMARLYEGPEHRRTLATAALQRVTDARYDWDVIASRWDELFTKTISQDQRKE